jgi:hypothetical protein
MSCLITMSQKELHRLEVIQKIRDERLSVVQAAELLDLSRSQVHRLLQAYDLDGPVGLVSKKRSRPSNRRHSEEFRNAALDLIRERYLDFGPTLAREKLIELHNISVAKETLRQWMTEAGIWVSRRERKKRVFQPRGRRDCFGELVQIDGSHHWWFENRGPKCALLVYIDDATGKLLHLRFAGSENTFDYLHATKAYLQQWGKPLAFYSDKHGVFRSTHASEKDRTSGLTQFGRALYELNIDIICANTPQAKGRVERANQTLQDRLVKELRLRGIDTIEAANAYASEFIADFNARFGKPPRNPKDMHRPLAEHENLDGAMCRKEVRTLSQALTLRYDKVLFILDPTEISRPLAGQKSSSATIRTAASRSCTRALPCPIEPSISCDRCIDPKSLRTSVWMTCCRSSLSCRLGGNSSVARAALAALARRIICLGYRMAARAMVIRSAVANPVGGRIS